MDDRTDRRFAEWLRAYMEMHRIPSNAVMGRKVGVSRAQVGNWLTGAHRPEPDTLRRVADGLRVDYAFLLALCGYAEGPGGEAAGPQFPAETLPYLTDLAEAPAPVLASFVQAWHAMKATLSEWAERDRRALNPDRDGDRARPARGRGRPRTGRSPRGADGPA